MHPKTGTEANQPRINSPVTDIWERRFGTSRIAGDPLGWFFGCLSFALGIIRLFLIRYAMESSVMR